MLYYEKVTEIIIENLIEIGLTDEEINYILERNPITGESINYGLFFWSDRI